MTGEQTILSKMLSPMINEYSIQDAILPLAAVVMFLGYVIEPLHPIFGLGILVAWYSLQGGRDYTKTHNLRRNGLYNLVEEGQEKNEGYTVLFIAGYEIARSKDFEVDNEEEEDTEIDIKREIKRHV